MFEGKTHLCRKAFTTHFSGGNCAQCSTPWTPMFEFCAQCSKRTGGRLPNRLAFGYTLYQEMEIHQIVCYDVEEGRS